jgi:nickel transport protein
MNMFQNLSGLKHKMTAGLFLACLSAMIVIIPSPVFAHKVSIFAWVEGDMVYTQSKFFGGKNLKNAHVEVFDASGNRLIESETNEIGEFSFRAPLKAEMKIVVSAGMGHQAVWYVKKTDFDGIQQDPLNDSKLSADVSHAPPAAARDAIPSAPDAALSVDSDEIRIIVEKALDKKMAPVLKMISELRERAPSMSDILGGIGYIIGLVGLAAYVSSRKKKDNLPK